MSTLPGISCGSPSVCGWAAQTQTLGSSARRMEQRTGFKVRLLHVGYSSEIAERLCYLWIVASMGRHNKPWRRLGGWGDPREGLILTERRTWHATCGIIASGAGRCLQTLERTLCTLGLCWASSSVRSCHSMLVQEIVDSEARRLHQSCETSLCCAVVADRGYRLATSVPGLSRHSRWAGCFHCSSVWHQHRLRQTGLISDALWCCWLWMWV